MKEAWENFLNCLRLILFFACFIFLLLHGSALQSRSETLKYMGNNLGEIRVVDFESLRLIMFICVGFCGLLLFSTENEDILRPVSNTFQLQSQIVLFRIHSPI